MLNSKQQGKSNSVERCCTVLYIVVQKRGVEKPRRKRWWLDWIAVAAHVGRC